MNSVLRRNDGSSKLLGVALDRLLARIIHERRGKTVEAQV